MIGRRAVAAKSPVSTVTDFEEFIVYELSELIPEEIAIVEESTRPSPKG